LDGGPEQSGARLQKTWVAADQIASSATNFGASALTAGLLTAAGFGAVSVAFAIYVIIAGAARAWACEPLVLVASHVEPGERSRLISFCLGTALAFGVVSGAATAASAAVLRGSPGAALLMLAVCLPGLLVHDSARYALVIQGRSRVAFESDVIWMAFSIATLMGLRVANIASVPLAVGAWGLGATLAALWATRGSGVRPTFRPRIWIDRVRHLSPILTLEFAIVHASSAMTLVLVTALTANLAQTGEFRGAQVLLGPTAMCFAATSLYLRPVLVRAYRSGESIVPRAVRESMYNTAVCLTWIVAVLLVPRFIGTRVFGLTWDGARSLVPIVSLSFIGLGAAAGAIDALRATGKLSAVVRVRALIAVVVLLSMFLFARLVEDHGAIIGFGVGSLLGSGLAWVVALRSDSLRRRP
jgi:hypothetical protein